MRKINQLKRKLKKGKVVLGTWCILPSPSVVNVISASGLDFLVIDMEHGPINYETAEDMVRAVESEGCSPLVRVPKNDEAEILRALDIGAHGVVVPHIENAQQRERTIKGIKYSPVGERGFTPYSRAGGYDPDEPGEHTKRENEETLSVLIVEGKKGIDNLGSIIDDPNVDVAFLGLCDLSQALGFPAQLGHPEVKKNVETCVKKIRGKGIAAGIFVNDLEMLRWSKEIGVQFITYSVDTTELCRSFKQVVKEFDDEGYRR